MMLRQRCFVITSLNVSLVAYNYKRQHLGYRSVNLRSIDRPAEPGARYKVVDSLVAGFLVLSVSSEGYRYPWLMIVAEWEKNLECIRYNRSKTVIFVWLIFLLPSVLYLDLSSLTRTVNFTLRSKVFFYSRQVC